MSQGAVIAIYVAPQTSASMVSVPEARAVSGRGLEGDRKYIHEGTPAQKSGPDRELTLIESEAIEAVPRDEKIELEPSETRRNLVTRGVALNHLVGREFRVGDVRLRGIRLCEPCSHLEKLTRPGVLRALIHRGGLRAQILNDGVIRVGEAVVAE
ncbi:MAG: MOSC domain-containing protein [Isosphaeraceae bacterium]|nr:MOSC domain-containing protein [Isosphaeraceae bacterium]